jgi:hypothetical protein
MIINEFVIRAKVKELFITRWTYSECESCEYPKHFRFDKAGVYHDEGCTCVDQERIRQRYTPSSYQEVVLIIEGLSEEDKANAIKFWRL